MRKVCSAKLRGLVDKECDPDTWGRDICIDASESIESQILLNTLNVQK